MPPRQEKRRGLEKLPPSWWLALLKNLVSSLTGDGGRVQCTNSGMKDSFVGYFSNGQDDVLIWIWAVQGRRVISPRANSLQVCSAEKSVIVRHCRNWTHGWVARVPFNLGNYSLRRRTSGRAVAYFHWGPLLRRSRQSNTRQYLSSPRWSG